MMLYTLFTSWIANLGLLLCCVGRQRPYAEKPRLNFLFLLLCCYWRHFTYRCLEFFRAFLRGGPCCFVKMLRSICTECNDMLWVFRQPHLHAGVITWGTLRACKNLEILLFRYEVGLPKSSPPCGGLNATRLVVALILRHGPAFSWLRELYSNWLPTVHSIFSLPTLSPSFSYRRVVHPGSLAGLSPADCCSTFP